MGGIPHETKQFLSTPSARRATGLGDKWFEDNQISIHALREEGDEIDSYLEETKIISIHALREEGDRLPTRETRKVRHFYPRPPRGGRQQKQRQKLYFQTNYTTFCTNLEEP